MFVLKFKSIAKYQVTHLLEQQNANNSASSSVSVKEVSEESSNSKIVESSTGTVTNEQTSQEEKNKSKSEKLDTFLNNYEDKDKIKVVKFIIKN